MEKRYKTGDYVALAIVRSGLIINMMVIGVDVHAHQAVPGLRELSDSWVQDEKLLYSRSRKCSHFHRLSIAKEHKSNCHCLHQMEELALQQMRQPGSRGVYIEGTHDPCDWR